VLLQRKMIDPRSLAEHARAALLENCSTPAD
jgi:hypothetical protein